GGADASRDLASRAGETTGPLGNGGIGARGPSKDPLTRSKENRASAASIEQPYWDPLQYAVPSRLGNPDARETPCSLLQTGGVRNLLKEFHHVMSLHSGSQMVSTLVADESAGSDLFAVALESEISGRGAMHPRLLSRDFNGRDVGHTIVVASESETSVTQPSKLLRGGEVVHMKGNFGNLLCRNLIMFSGPRYTVKYKKAARHTWHVCVREILKTADELKLKSIAIPICYCVRKGYPLKESVHIMLRTIRRWLDLLPNNIEEVILVTPFTEHYNLAKELLRIYFPRFMREGDVLLYEELHEWMAIESMTKDSSMDKVEADEGDAQQQARARLMLLQAQFFGDPQTGEYVDSRDGKKAHESLKRMIKKKKQKADDALTCKSPEDVDASAAPSSALTRRDEDERSDDGELIENFVGDWDHVAQRRLSMTMWEAESAIECARIYFRTLRHCHEMQARNLDFLIDNSAGGGAGNPGGPRPVIVPHMWLLGDRVPVRFTEEQLLGFFVSKIESFRDMATPAPGRLVQECYLVYAHATGQYLPASRQFFGEIVRTIEWIMPGMQLIIVHPTVAIKLSL
ncbi:unnamed protein product, partial [Amoebophrya sp. A25]